MDSNNDCLGVVLAGGRSKRMGSDKAQLLWQGRRLIDRSFELLRAAGCSRVVVSGDYPQYPHIPDQFPDRGPLGGLASVAQSEPESRWLVSAIDQPLLDVSMLRALLDGLMAGSETGRQVCRYGEEPLPMAFLVTPATRRWMQLAVAGDSPGHRSLKALQEYLRIHALPADTEVRARLRGVNTPSDWDTLHDAG